MKAFTTLLLFFPLVGSIFAAVARPIKGTTCQEIKIEEADKWAWTQLGPLETEPNHQYNLWRSAVVKVNRNGANGARKRSSTKYTYTVSGGILAVNSHYPQAFAQVQRASGKGEGQEFVVNFYDVSINRKILKQYRIYPNEICSTPSLFTAAQIGKISVWAKTA